MRTARPRHPRGFTLIEAMVATAITVMAGSALLLGISSALETTNDILDQAIANGIAQRLMDEIAGKLYAGPGAGAQQYPLGPNTTETAGVSRERYDDIDDYVSISNQPPNDCWGIALGTDNGQGGTRDPKFAINNSFFSGWQQTVSVYYVKTSDPSQALPAGQTSDFRAVDVKVFFNDPVTGSRQLARLRRVFNYVSN